MTMNKLSKPIVIDLMRQAKEACEQILEAAIRELSLAKSKGDERNIKSFAHDVEEIKCIIKIANAVIRDLEARKISHCTPILVHETAKLIRRRMHMVAAKRSLNNLVIARFEEADKLMNL